MSPLEDLKQTLSAMGRSGVPVDDPEVEGERGVRVVGRLERFIEAQSQAHQRREGRTRGVKSLAALAAVAASILLVYNLYPLLSISPAERAAAVGQQGPLSVRSPGGSRSMPPGQQAEVAAGDEVATASDGTARLELPGGVEVKAASDTHLRLATLVDDASVIDVNRGTVTVAVPKLHPGGSFAVVTPDARIVVHGTAFAVEVGSTAAGPWTTVTVSEGVVSVEHDTDRLTLQRGDRWSSKPRGFVAATQAAPSPAPAEERQATAEPRRRTARAPVAGSVPRREEPAAAPPGPTVAAFSLDDAPEANGTALGSASGTAPHDALREQNELFSRARQARRAGETGRALMLLDELLGKYPGAPMTHEARVEQLRALRSSGQHARAVTAARRYLARYPDGFAAVEAKAVLRGSAGVSNTHGEQQDESL